MLQRDLSVLRGPDLPYRHGRRIEDAVRHWARRTPDAVAVRSGDVQLTYGQLVGAAERCAAGLRELGVRAGDLLAVRLDRGPELVTVLLGVLCVGAAYTTVPPDWPDARFQTVRTATAAVLTVSAGPAEGAVPVAELLGGTAEVAAPLRHAAPVPADTACVFFTSGSSGSPKGALSPHTGTLRIAVDPMLRFTPGTVMLQAAPLPWDACAMELWAPLTSGGTTMLHDDPYLGVAALRAAIARGVNTLFLTTALFNAIVDDDPAAFAGLEHLMTGGERVSPRHIAACRDRHPGMRLSHVYGPVEGTIYSTGHPVTSIRPDADDVPIGLAMANTTVFVLDPDDGVVPAGEIGEIVIAGDGLAAGYVADSTETDRRFAELPLGPDGTRVRVYRTGDRGVVMDGSLRFLGRVDRQVKIRGVRIEPGEVEKVMERVAGVRRAVVLPIPVDEPVKRSLVGFYTTAGAAVPVDGDTVGDRLRELLPPAYVPDRFLAVTDFPTGATGKVDAAALAARLGAVPVAPVEPKAQAVELPPTLRSVLRITAELMHNRLGPDEDIFLHGASSIDAIQLANRLVAEGYEAIASDVLRGRKPRRIAELVDARTQPCTT